ncbi:MAG TPA: glucosaminidase domain-containing protein [Prolixibacteraceae bacterium]|nr:glucosaminidase domain-containing protein [Prolixibacteraceae bacterium]
MKQVLFISVSVLLFVSLIANSQTRLSRKEYIEAYKVLAVSEMVRSGIPASITMAQGCLESENGNSSLARKSNNHFGIKCRSDWSGARVYHNDDNINECFRKYQTVEESYIDHSNFLKANSRYSNLFSLEKTDYKAWSHGLKAAGYATNPKYASLLIKIIEEENLFLLDKLTSEELTAYKKEIAADRKDSGNPARENLSKAKNKVIDAFGNLTLNPFREREIYTVNGLEAIDAVSGDTYESIAREFNMKLWEVHLYNDLPREAVNPQSRDRVYLQRKRFSAPKEFDFHVVKSGESMWSISQQYGLRVNRLYRINRMKSNDAPAVGQRLYLRKMKPKKDQ